MAGPLKEVDVDQYGSQQKTSTTEVVHMITPITMVFRRDVPIDSTALIAANTTKGAIEFDPNSTTIPKEGDWVVLDETTGEASLAADDNWAYLVWAGRERLDVAGSSSVTILVGDYLAETTAYRANVATATWGDHLYTDYDATTGDTFLTATGTNNPVARFEGTTTRNGEVYVRFRAIS